MPKHQKILINSAIKIDARINHINRLLEVLAKEIKKTQPIRPGSITLHFHNCGNECSACPHTTWLQWYSRKTRKEGAKDMFLSRKIDNPARRIKRGGEFADGYEETRRNILIAEQLIKEKKKLIELSKSFNATAQHLENHSGRELLEV